MAVSAWSQGNIFFSNEPLSTGNTVNAPVRDEGGVLLAGSAFQALLYARPAGSTAAYQAIGAQAAFLPAGASPSGNGYWTPGARQIPGVPSGEVAQVVARVWRVADGATWDAARTAGRGYAESAPINVTLTGGTTLPARMAGLQPFALVPEPSTIALGIIGGLGTLLLIRRRK